MLPVLKPHLSPTQILLSTTPDRRDPSRPDHSPFASSSEEHGPRNFKYKALASATNTSPSAPSMPKPNDPRLASSILVMSFSSSRKVLRICMIPALASGIEHQRKSTNSKSKPWRRPRRHLHPQTSLRLRTLRTVYLMCLWSLKLPSHMACSTLARCMKGLRILLLSRVERTHTFLFKPQHKTRRLLKIRSKVLVNCNQLPLKSTSMSWTPKRYSPQEQTRKTRSPRK